MIGRLTAGLIAVALLAAQRSPTALPAPTGRYAIGRVEFDWTDSSRTETLAAEAGARRELVVELWYPADAGSRGQGPADYVPHAEALDRAPAAERLRQLFGAAWPAVVSGSIDSHAIEAADPARQPARFPLLLFSHGLGVVPSAYTGLIEELVSHGYVVAAIAHPYEAAAVAFADGRVVGIAPQPPMRGDLPRREAMKAIVAHEAERDEVWAADIRFVLDRLTALNHASLKQFLLAGALDLQAVGAFGHSVGGRAVARACQLDARIRACVNEDGASPEGAFLNYPGARSPSQPFLFVQSPAPPPPTDAQLAQFHDTREDWNRFVAESTGNTDRQLSECASGSYRVVMKTPGFEHMSFSDLPLLASAGAEYRQALLSLQLAGLMTLQFFDRYLRGNPALVLDGHTRLDSISIVRYAPTR